MIVAGGIVVAAGAGRRLGSDVPKAFVTVAGASLVARAVAVLRAAGVDPLVVVVPDGWEDDARSDLGPSVEVVTGAGTRTASVAAGLAALPDDVSVVAVHDAARPLIPVEVAADVVAAVGGDVVAAAPGVPVPDTLKRVGDDDVVEATVDRARLVAIQTPQVFRRDVLEAGHAWARANDDAPTDDLALVERLVEEGSVPGRVVATPGSVLGLKVTSPADLLVVTALATANDVLDPGDGP